MKVFLDTNIFMEYVSCRKQYETIRDVFDAIEDGKITAVMSIGGLYTLTFLITRLLKESNIHRPEQTEKLRIVLKGLLQLAPIVDCSQEVAFEAVADERFTDIEDSLQYHCAKQNSCDVLLTINIKDFKKVIDGDLRIISPQEFVSEFL